ncbi:Meiosis-specific protein MEI4 [Collichthys lucidus]|uniref:Meiosis-specific protein MEI4 n=1 Tax=Collichthys lucidus TaxID=240159 RepID=A0A4U5UP63_COLLU|nr:Meiosis-specific protein MEI4 [Collichthys lucidus]
MESQDERQTGATQAEHFLLKARLAVAAAIIKSKPRGVSGRQHAEELAAMLERQDEGWKKKAQELQQEVLRLRQEVLISKVTANANNSMEAAGHGCVCGVCVCVSDEAEYFCAPSSGHDETMDISSQDLFGPESVGFSDSDTPDLLLDDLRPAIPSHQPPQPPVPSSDDGGPRGKASLPHVHFLQSLCSLHRVEESSRGLESLWFHPDGGVDSVLVDSVCQLLDSVVAACRDHLPLPGPCDFVLEGCRVAAQAMELFCSQRLPSVEFMRRVEEPLTALTGMLLQSNQLSGLRAAEKLMEYLITLGSCSMSQAFLIRHVLSQISALADQLWQAFQFISIPPATIVNAKQAVTPIQPVVKRADRSHLSRDSALTQASMFQSIISGETLTAPLGVRLETTC